MRNIESEDSILMTRVRSILADARLLDDYLVNAGLARDSKLINSILDLEEAITEGTLIRQKYENLRMEYIASLKIAESYITIEQLRADLSPFHLKNSRGLKNVIYKQILVSILAVFLILSSVLGFVVTQDISRRIADLEKISVQNPLQKLTDLRRLVDEGALDDPKKAIYTQYQKASAEVATLFVTTHSILNRTPQPEQFEHQGGILYEIVRIIKWEVGSRLILKAEKESETTRTPLPNSEKDNVSQSLICKDPSFINYGYSSKNLRNAALDKLNDYCFAQVLGLGSYPYRDVSVKNGIRVLQQELAIVGVLLLPLLGGFLGATVFVIHLLMNDRLHPPISGAYLFVRIIVGGSFGVIIGWFASTSTDSGELAQQISGTPFSLAFLAGFSIETLTTVLLSYSKPRVLKK